MNFWVVKCREKKADGKRGGHWDNYLKGNWEVSEGWGGKNWIKNNESKKYIRDKVRKGDLVVCYQYEGREILGLTRMESEGGEDPEDSGQFNTLFFSKSRKALRLAQPITIKELRDSKCDPSCFKRGKQGTIFPLDKVEFDGILAVISNSSVSNKKKLHNWLNKVNYKLKA